MKYVAIEAKIEAKDGAIKFSFQRADDPAFVARSLPSWSPC
jgi:hypothetical protein